MKIWSSLAFAASMVASVDISVGLDVELTLGPAISGELGDGPASTLQPEAFRNGRATVDTGIPTLSEGLGTSAPKLKKTYESLDYYDNVRLSGGIAFIPPDPNGAAGHSRLLAVTNVAIECRNFGGQLMWEGLLRDLFPGLTEGFTFDPKVFYDRHSKRFVVVTLDRDLESEVPMSKILLAVSKDGTPNGLDDFDLYEIDALTTVDGADYWADYPGFEAGRDAIYITNNLFPVDGGFGLGSQAWIIDENKLYSEKTLDFYIIPIYDFSVAGTFMPAKIEGDKEPQIDIDGTTYDVGTFFVGYDGLSAGGGFAPHAVEVIWLGDPLGAPVLDRVFVPIFDLECFSFEPLPDAPQAGGSRTIETNDRRALDATWRDDALWMTFQTGRKTCDDDPLYTKANYAKMDTSAYVIDIFGSTFQLDEYGLIPQDNIDPVGDEVATFFPAVAVNRDGEAYFAFSASSPNMYAGAFLAGTAPGTEQCVKEGEGYYFIDFGSDRNRWGDYLGISVDPSNDDFFWVHEQYAANLEYEGSESVVWATVWARTTGKESAAKNN